MLIEQSVDTAVIKDAKLVKAVYVYQAPVRFWHWLNALSILTLAATGWFIASPLPALPGEASDNFLMGYIRFAHFAAGYVLAVGWLVRIYWAFAGNNHSQQLFVIPVWSKHWWSEVLWELRWYLFLERQPKKYIGHNPMAQLAMFLMFTIPMFLMIITGFALYGEGLGHGSWADVLFGWVFGIFANSQQVHSLHHLGMWVIVTFVIVHVYAAIREDIMSRQSMVSTMLSGWRMFKD